MSIVILKMFCKNGTESNINFYSKKAEGRNIEKYEIILLKF